MDGAYQCGVEVGFYVEGLVEASEVLGCHVDAYDPSLVGGVA